ncbi:MAG: diheme cytochrome c [Deltaproteobacteria bacterium]|nr:diheme cytochrome c [Deltaproteobacteria bacterium]
MGEKRGHHNNGPYSPVTNETYKDACGACHFPYQPWLLPSGSWRKLLSSIKDHFGQTVDLEAESKRVIEINLADNAAEKSHMKKARKIVRSLKGDTPLRITEVPCIRRKHRDIPPEVFTRKAVGSLSNCSACHKTADQGIYDDDYVTIPQ